ncbi:HPAT1 [Scenedesmus sp. PABB004]|nr:HPAT1 [Scenedesmus sp. PABB004]
MGPRGLLGSAGGAPPRRAAAWGRRVGGASSLQGAALLAGLLCGLLAGSLHQRRTRAVLIEALHTRGGATLEQEPVVTSFGYKLVLHDFSQPGAAADGGGGGGGGGLPGPGGGGFSGHDAAAAQVQAAVQAAAAQAQPQAAAQQAAQRAPRFHRGGKGGSVMWSASNATGLTPADAARISAALTKRAAELPGDSVHALMTGNGSPYQNIQARIMVASMRLIQAAPGGSNIKAFTRIMHRTTDDDLVGEPACDTWCEFPVKDRANAVVQWLMAAAEHPELVQGAWLLLLESDYVWMKPLTLPGSAHDVAVAGYGFTYDYIDPTYPAAAAVVSEMCPSCDVARVPHSGPSPVLLRPGELARVAPDWETYSAWIEGNANARSVLGWVREMYAWCVSVHKNGVTLTHAAPPASLLLAQPPHDAAAGSAAMLHYTWGALFNKGGKEFWRFDKRDWTAKEHELKARWRPGAARGARHARARRRPGGRERSAAARPRRPAAQVPQFPLPPPWEENVTLQDGVPVSRELHAVMTAMLTQMNAASATLPELTAGGAAR